MIGNDDNTSSKKTLLGRLFGGGKKDVPVSNVRTQPARNTPQVELAGDEEDKTTSKTIWSETLIDLLIVTLQKNRPDTEISKLLVELQSKGFKKDYLIDKVTRSINAATGERIKRLLG